VVAAHAVAADWAFAFDDPVAAYQQFQHRRTLRISNQPPTIADYPQWVAAQVAGFHWWASVIWNSFKESSPNTSP